MSKLNKSYFMKWCYIILSVILTCCHTDKKGILIYNSFLVNIPEEYQICDKDESINFEVLRGGDIEHYFVDGNTLIYFSKDSLSSEFTIIDYEKMFLEKSDLYNRKEKQRNFNFILHESNRESFSVMFTSQYLGNTIFHYYYYFELDNILYGLSYSNQGDNINWEEDSVLAIGIKESIRRVTGGNTR